MANRGHSKIILQDKGISATHPIILQQLSDKVIVCSVADERKKFNKKFNYTILFRKEKFPFDGTTEEILNHIIQKEYHLESEKGHKLALSSGLPKELLDEAKELAKKYIKNGE